MEKKIPNYVIKQIIAKELYTRNNNITEQLMNTSSQPKSKLKDMFDNATETADLADQIRMGRIPLEQCLNELTIDEKKNVYQQCEEWFEKNKEKNKEPEI